LPSDLDPSDERCREVDAAALHKELTELRSLPRGVLTRVSTSLTIGAASLAARNDPEGSAVAMSVARLLYVIAHEKTPKLAK
jgi:hypothetical protein